MFRNQTSISCLTALNIFLLFNVTGSAQLRAMYKAEQNGVSLTLIEYCKHEHVDLFDTQFPIESSYMVTPEHFHKRGIYPVGIIVHNKGAVPIKISAQSIPGHDIEPIIQRCRVINQKDDMNISWITLPFIGFILGGINLMDRAFTSYSDLLGRYAHTKLALFISLLIAGLVVKSELVDARFEETLRSRLLLQERVIRPGQKIILYTLFNAHERWVNRAEYGILTGITFSLFDAQNQVHTTFVVEGYDHAA